MASFRSSAAPTGESLVGGGASDLSSASADDVTACFTKGAGADLLDITDLLGNFASCGGANALSGGCVRFLGFRRLRRGRHGFQTLVAHQRNRDDRGYRN
jgi:hypothetical protein